MEPILHNVQLSFHFSGFWKIDEKKRKKIAENVRIVLGHLLPLIDNIRTLFLDEFTLPIMAQHFTEQYLRVRRLRFDYEYGRLDKRIGNTILDWLTVTEPEGFGGRPRLCIFNMHHIEDEHFIPNLHQVGLGKF